VGKGEGSPKAEGRNPKGEGRNPKAEIRATRFPNEVDSSVAQNGIVRSLGVTCGPGSLTRSRLQIGDTADYKSALPPFTEVARLGLWAEGRAQGLDVFDL
jgi:hypothetical protein